MGPLRICLIIFICFSCFAFRNAYGARINPSSGHIVKGHVYCDSCLEQKFTSQSILLPNVTMVLECREQNGKLAFGTIQKTDMNGTFSMELPTSVEPSKCTIGMVDSQPNLAPSLSSCTKNIWKGQLHPKLKGSQHGAKIYGAGPFVLKPAQKLQLCSKVPHSPQLTVSEMVSPVPETYLPLKHFKPLPFPHKVYPDVPKEPVPYGKLPPHEPLPQLPVPHVPKKEYPHEPLPPLKPLPHHKVYPDVPVPKEKPIPCHHKPLPKVPPHLPKKEHPIPKKEPIPYGNLPPHEPLKPLPKVPLPHFPKEKPPHVPLKPIPEVPYPHEKLPPHEPLKTLPELPPILHEKVPPFIPLPQVIPIPPVPNVHPLPVPLKEQKDLKDMKLYKAEPIPHDVIAPLPTEVPHEVPHEVPVIPPLHKEEPLPQDIPVVLPTAHPKAPLPIPYETIPPFHKEPLPHEVIPPIPKVEPVPIPEVLPPLHEEEPPHEVPYKEPVAIPHEPVPIPHEPIPVPHEIVPPVEKEPIPHELPHEEPIPHELPHEEPIPHELPHHEPIPLEGEGGVPFPFWPIPFGISQAMKFFPPISTFFNFPSKPNP